MIVVAFLCSSYKPCKCSSHSFWYDILHCISVTSAFDTHAIHNEDTTFYKRASTHRLISLALLLIGSTSYIKLFIVLRCSAHPSPTSPPLPVCSCKIPIPHPRIPIIKKKWVVEWMNGSRGVRLMKLTISASSAVSPSHLPLFFSFTAPLDNPEA